MVNYIVGRMEQIIRDAAPTTRFTTNEGDAWRVYFEKSPDIDEDFVQFTLISIVENDVLDNGPSQYDFQIDIHISDRIERFNVLDRIRDNHKIISLGGSPTEDEDIGTSFSLSVRYNQ